MGSSKKDLNAAKRPAEALFYTDIKSYEQQWRQHISKVIKDNAAPMGDAYCNFILNVAPTVMVWLIITLWQLSKR